MLTEIDDNIWLVDGPNVNFYGCPYPTRMVIVRLPGGDLWVWSPIRLTDDLQEAVNALGRVAHLVSPNKIHHLFLQDWNAVWPDARLWGPASTIKKRSDLNFEPALEHTPPADWQGVIDQFWFRGSIAMDEIAFLHTPSGTAIFADLSENFSQSFLEANWKNWQRMVANLWGIVQGKGYAPLEWRLSWIDRTSARKTILRLIGRKPEHVIMAHGEWIDTGADVFLRRAFSWLLKE
ncbi:MAG: DUF4336 domain-containing protein [Alphaproteobacteria bacterium]|nr:DUF4336 domain-containing protein [Hyphomonas sp.]MBR9806848.1 DUF4336 domain-containing protein [Alphaproteobacteria bacterium]|tara:strand:+ start:1612 stop:2316 length:705 start_codon:yes stop_codon:yes gene_type:complete